jgi:site-specific DNA-methyltransferase (adenine-specific)
VKAGHVHVSHVRDLRGVLDREKAAIGVLISMKPPTKQMRTEAAAAGTYQDPWGQRYPRLQLLTIKELLDGGGIHMPPVGTMAANATYRPAQRAPRRSASSRQSPASISSGADAPLFDLS